PANLKYTPTHEWVLSEADGTLTIGITDHAQEALGDLVFIELPEPGRRVVAKEACAVVESVKAASDIYAPVTGEIIAVNARDADQAEMLRTLGLTSRAALIDEVMPAAIRSRCALGLPAAKGEQEAQDELKAIARKNRVLKSFIGQGYYGTLTPGVILRNVLEN